MLYWPSPPELAGALIAVLCGLGFALTIGACFMADLDPDPRDGSG